MNFNDDDYLWNGTGEPDPDVQRLERALGKLRYQHTELKLPAPAPVPRHARHAMLRQSLVAAAVAFVMLAAGTWLYFRRSGDDLAPRKEVAIVSERTSATPQSERAGRRTGDAGQTDGARNLAEGNGSTAATVAGTRDDAARVGQPGHIGQPGHVAQPGRVAAQRVRKIDEGNGVGARLRVVPVAAVNVASTTSASASASAKRAEGERAKRQLMLALYITSDKLAFVQKKVQGDARMSPSNIEPERDLLR